MPLVNAFGALSLEATQQLIKSSLADIDAIIGPISGSPPANTLQARLQTIHADLTALQATLNTTATEATLTSVLNAITAQIDLSNTLWTDDSGAYYVRRDTINEGTYTVFFTDPSGTTVTPGPGLRPIAATDKELEQAIFDATGSGTGYTAGDMLARLSIIDTNTSPISIVALWLNLTTGEQLTTNPTGGTYVENTKNVTVVGGQIDITDRSNRLLGHITVDNPSLVVNDPGLPDTLGQNPMAGSTSVTIASDQSTIPTSNANIDTALSTRATEATLALVKGNLDTIIATQTNATQKTQSIDKHLVDTALDVTEQSVAPLSTFTTPFIDVLNYNNIQIDASVNFLGRIWLEWSINPDTVHHGFSTLLIGNAGFNTPINARYVRIRFDSLDTSNTATLTTRVAVKTMVAGPILARMTAPLDSNLVAALTRSILVGFKSDGVTSANIGITDNNDLRVGQQAIVDTNNTFSVSIPAFLGVPYVPNTGGAPGSLPADTVAGGWTKIQDFSQFTVSGNFVALGQGYAEWSNDGGVTINHFETTQFGGGGGSISIPSNGSTHYRIVFQNRSGAPFTFKAKVILRYLPISAFTFPTRTSIHPSFPSALTTSVGAGQPPDGDDDPFNTLLTKVRTQGLHTLGSTSTPLPGDTGGTNHIFRGKWFAWQKNYGKALLNLTTDVAGTCYVELSNDISPSNLDDSGTLSGASIPLPYSPSIDGLLRLFPIVSSRWIRIRYVNGPAAQSRLTLDMSFFVNDPGLVVKTASTMVGGDVLTGIVDAVDSSERQEVSGEYVHVKTTRNTTTNKDGKNVHITGLDTNVKVFPLRVFQNGQLNVSSSRVQIPAPTISNVKALSVTNMDGDTDVFWGDNSITATAGSDVILSRGAKDLDLDGSSPIFLIAAASGAATGTSNRYAASTQNNSGVITPNNLLADDTNYAVFDNQGDTVQLTGFTPAGAYPIISNVNLKFKANKNATIGSETATVAETQTGAILTGGTITSASITGGTNQLYVAFITRNSDTNTITGVTGLGLTWAARVQNVTNGGGGRRIDAWYAFGNATTGTVSATQSTSTNAHIAVLRIVGAHPSTPIENNGSTVGSGTSVTGPVLNGTASGLSLMGISHESSGTAGISYTENVDTSNGVGANIDGISVESKQLFTTGNETATYTLAAPDVWQAISLTILPAPANNPIITVTYKVGTDPVGTTTMVAAVSSTSDQTFTVNIFGDRAWIPADITNTVLTLTSTTMTVQPVNGNVAWLDVTESEAAAIARVTYSWIGEG